MLNKVEIEEQESKVEDFANKIEILNYENISEVEEDEIVDLGLSEDIIKDIKKYGIKLFYSNIAGFYPFLTYYTEEDNIQTFMENYVSEIDEWCDNELDAFNDTAEPATLVEVYDKIFDCESDKMAYWLTDPLNNTSWEEVYLDTYTNGVKIVRHETAMDNSIRVIDADKDIHEITDRLIAGETLCEIYNDCDY